MVVATKKTGRPKPASRPTKAATRPKATKAKPKATRAKPKATKAKPRATKAKPRTTKAKPRATKAKPKATKAKPKATKAKPRATKAKPKATKAKIVRKTSAQPEARVGKAQNATKAKTDRPGKTTKCSDVRDGTIKESDLCTEDAFDADLNIKEKGETAICYGSKQCTTKETMRKYLTMRLENGTPLDQIRDPFNMGVMTQRVMIQILGAEEFNRLRSSSRTNDDNEADFENDDLNEGDLDLLPAFDGDDMDIPPLPSRHEW
jgi:hypothetical protein